MKEVLATDLGCYSNGVWRVGNVEYRGMCLHTQCSYVVGQYCHYLKKVYVNLTRFSKVCETRQHYSNMTVY